MAFKNMFEIFSTTFPGDPLTNVHQFLETKVFLCQTIKLKVLVTAVHSLGPLYMIPLRRDEMRAVNSINTGTITPGKIPMFG